jgi:integrase
MQAKITTRLVSGLRPKDTPYEVFDTALSGFLLRIQPTGRMNYYLDYRTIEGRRRRYRLGNAEALTVRQARDLAEREAARVTTGVDIQSERQQIRHEAQAIRTLEDFLDHHYAHWVMAERPSGAETLARLRHNFADLLSRPMEEITPWLIEKWRAAERKRAKAPSTINRDLTVLKAALSKAVDWEVLKVHPLLKVKPIKIDRQGKVRYLSQDEEDRLRTALANRDDRLKQARERGNIWRQDRGYPTMPSIVQHTYGDHLTPMVLLSLNTGLRRGEVFNLTWDHVNFQTRILTVEGQGTKTGQTRHIPLNDEALTVVRAWQAQSTSEGFVFPGKNGNRLDNVRKSWAGVLHEADITGFRWHDLRHDFASKLVMAGVPLNTVRDLLGHSTMIMTLRYAPLAPDHKAEAVARLRRMVHTQKEATG